MNFQVNADGITATAKRNAVLILADGQTFWGQGIGNPGSCLGEICFNTSMTGYQEILTDPSYAGQIITFTFPHIGNVGVNDEDMEALGPHCHGLIIREPISSNDNFRSQNNFNDWLIKQQLTGICGIDTRSLVIKIRTGGAQNCLIHYAENGEVINLAKLHERVQKHPSMQGQELAHTVSTPSSYNWHKKSWQLSGTPSSNSDTNQPNVVVLDFGVKQNILRCLADHGVKLTILPATSSVDEILSHHPDGIFLSNGPGDPFATASKVVPTIQSLLAHNIPMLGICMGHQLLSLAVGMQTTKMLQGHRGGNHPVLNLQSKKVEITSQNHGFCVSKQAIPNNVQITHLSLFDQSIEGIRLTDKPVFSVQHHPEASPGPHDSYYVFSEFIEMIKQAKQPI